LWRELDVGKVHGIRAAVGVMADHPELGGVIAQRWECHIAKILTRLIRIAHDRTLNLSGMTSKRKLALQNWKFMKTGYLLASFRQKPL
jgi:hypothetical protein